MNKGTERDHGGHAPGKGDAAGTSAWRRPEGRFYNFTRQHFELLEDLSRMYPDLGDRLDLSRLEPGTESIESVSQLLLDCMEEEPGEHLFLAFCRLNTDRLLDHIHLSLQRGAWPLSADGVLRQVYGNLYREMRHRRLGLQDAPSRRLLQRARSDSAFRTLSEEADRVIGEQVSDLRARSLPLPGVPSPSVEAGPALLENGRAVVTEHSVELTDEELGQWVCHALMNLDDVDRRMLYLRDRLDLGVEEIARQAGQAPLDVMRVLQQARLRFQDLLLDLITTFCDEGPADVGTLKFDVPGEEGDDAR